MMHNVNPTNHILDWDKCVKLAGNKPDLARDLLNALAKTLPNEFTQIKAAWHLRSLPDLKKKIHALRGALSYCGVPQLNENLKELETHIKNKKFISIDKLLKAIDLNIAELQNAIKEQE